MKSALFSNKVQLQTASLQLRCKGLMVQPQHYCRNSGMMGGRITFTILFFTQNVHIWKTNVGFGTQGRNFDILRLRNPDVWSRWQYPEICQRWHLPPGYLNPASGGVHERWGKCAGPGSSGCMFAQAAADSCGDDVAGATPAASLARAYTQKAHVNTLTHWAASTRRPTRSNTRL